MPKYERPVCRGCWTLGTACERCERCAETKPQPSSFPPQPTAGAGKEGCDWPDGQGFSFHDEPGAHDPCYVVMPCGAMLPVNHHAGEGVDVARAKFIIAACNAALGLPNA